MTKVEQIRKAAEADLEAFIKLVTPRRVLGSVHSELITWMTREDAGTHQLVLLPRDHQKSAMAGYYAAWAITRNPAIRILYISNTSTIATKQLKFIKDILLSDVYRMYWPEMVNPDEGKREKWTESEIAVDHPLRREESIRDSTVFTAGLTTSIAGLHCDLIIEDDIVVKDNAYTEEGRERVRQQHSLLASIKGADARALVVGTRYHPNDLYADMITTEVESFTAEGDSLGFKSLYEVFERQVENVGDGSGEFLWPRQSRYDGTRFGFDRNILEQKRAEYYDKVQFRAQYYNDPNDSSQAGISRDCFNYYDRAMVARSGGDWYVNGHRLNVTAAIDFAYSTNKKSDYTAIVVVGVDQFRNYYVLDIDRFKTDKISDMYNHLLVLHQKWQFRKLRAEVTAAQSMIVKDLKQNYIQKYGLTLSVEDHRPTRTDGNKEERMSAILQPRYQERQMWHYRGGHCQTLEEELLLQNPPHDDVKDCLTIAIEGSVAPSAPMAHRTSLNLNYTHERFGGIA